MVIELEENQDLQDAVLSVHHALRHTFGSSTVLKLIENHMGKRYVRHDLRAYMLQQPVPQPAPPGGILPPGP